MGLVRIAFRPFLLLFYQCESLPLAVDIDGHGQRDGYVDHLYQDDAAKHTNDYVVIRSIGHQSLECIHAASEANSTEVLLYSDTGL